MSTYRYTAVTLEGDETAGTIEAATIDDALELLLQRGLQLIQVLPVSDRSSDSVRAPVALSSAEAGELSQHIAQVSSAGIPLSAGLRAAAEETSNWHVASALQWMAEQLEQGRSLEETLTESGRLVPPHITGLILAALRTGSIGEALIELVELQQKTYALRRELWSYLAYPIFVAGLAAVILIGLGYFVLGMFHNVFDEFGLRLPAITLGVLWWRATGMQIVGGLLVVGLLLLFLLRLLGGERRWCRLRATMPILGGLWRWTATAEWSGLLSVLLRHQVPLPEALRSAGRGARDAQIEFLSRRLADGVARGRSLAQMLFATPELPAALIPMVDWGERTGNLSESFRMGQEMLSRRARSRAMLLQLTVPSLLFICTGSLIMLVLVATFMPLIDLISVLS